MDVKPHEGLVLATEELASKVLQMIQMNRDWSEIEVKAYALSEMVRYCRLSGEGRLTEKEPEYGR